MADGGPQCLHSTKLFPIAVSGQFIGDVFGLSSATCGDDFGLLDRELGDGIYRFMWVVAMYMGLLADYPLLQVFPGFGFLLTCDRLSLYPHDPRLSNPSLARARRCLEGTGL